MPTPRATSRASIALPRSISDKAILAETISDAMVLRLTVWSVTYPLPEAGGVGRVGASPSTLMVSFGLAAR